MQRSFKISAVWDENAEVWTSESDIIGLHIEAETLDDFEAVMRDIASELIIANHYQPSDLINRSIAELVPAIIWNRPQKQAIRA